MSNSFLKIFIKALKIIKKEPIVMVPFVAFQLIVVVFTQLISKNNADTIQNNMSNLGLFDWLIPTLILQPIIIIIALNIIQKKPINIAETLQKCIKCILPLFLVSLLTKPLFLIGTYKILSKTSLTTKSIESLSIQTLSVSLAYIGLSLIIHLITIFFPSHFVLNVSKTPKVSIILNQAIKGLFQFKWIAIYYLILYSLLIFIVQAFFISIITATMPNHLELLFLGTLNGIERTIFTIFILRIWLYIRPLTHIR